jgi:uncharacterized repeat protein (TIGR01451 family)
MKQLYRNRRGVVIFVFLIAVVLCLTGTSQAATNQATNAGSVGITLSDSGSVTVTATALQLVKQVYSAAGVCLASSPADANCNASATSVVVPSSTQLKFVIFVRNTSDISLTDVRIQDLLDDTAGAAGGFTYVANTIKVDSSQTDAAAIANIYTAVNAVPTTQTDVLGAPDDFASMDTTVSPDRLTVGAVTGQANTAVTVAGHTTFAVLFQATKN